MRKIVISAMILIFGGQIFAQMAPIMQNSLMPQQSMMGGQMMMGGQSSATLNMSSSQDISMKDDGFTRRSHSGTSLYIDESIYYLGSGDILRAVVWGISETILDISVVGETCIIPTVGALDVGFITLNEAREKIISMIRKRYKADRVDVFITNIKDVSVQIQGQVNNPNTYTIPGNLSISSIIEQIGGTTSDANLREIQLINPKYGTRVIDIVKMNRIAGYPSAYLRNGDRIFVPMKDLRVSIVGDVQNSGNYDFVDGDKLSDLIILSGGMLSTADSSRIIITRFVGLGSETEKITLTAEVADTFALEKDDMILVSRKAEYRPIRRVKISGEVNFPGTYSIEESRTRLIDIIAQAGGLTEQAFLGGSKIVRRSFIDVAGSEQNRLQNASGKVQITPIESNFLKFRASGETQVSIDFSKLKMNRNAIENVILKENDEIYIQKSDFMINVMGGVVRPGLVEFSQDKDLSYYIEKAGGYKKRIVKRKVKVITAGSEVWLRPSQVKNIEQGDAIWVPERDFVERQERQQDVSIRGGVVGIIGSVATTITAALTIIMFVDSQK